MRWPQFHDPAVAEHFRKHGYAVAPLLAAEEVAALRLALDDIMQEFGVGGAGSDDQFHISYYNADAAYQERIAQCVRAAFAPALGRLLDGYRISAGGAFIKVPGGEEMGVHCDYNATTDPDAVTFTVWCALADVDDDNGAMCMLPGSHRVEGQIIGPGVTPFFEHYPEKIRSRSVSVPMRAGEALMFKSGVIHWSLPNRSSRNRPAAHFVAVPEGVRHVIYMPSGTVPPERFEVRDLTDVLAFHSPESAPSLGFVDHINPAFPWPQLERLVDEAGGMARQAERPSFLNRFGAVARRMLKRKAA